MVQQDLKSIARKFPGAVPDLGAFEDIFARRVDDKAIKIPRAMEANFADPATPQEKRIRASIDKFNGQLRTVLEKEQFTQTKRFNDAERSLKVKETVKAKEDLRISGDKITKAKARLKALNDNVLRPNDSRIFPMVYAPVVVMKDGKLLIRPMRYHCRPNGQLESMDRKFPGVYNARRDTMNKPKSLWKPLFGHHHGVMIVKSFFENVLRHNFEHRALKTGEEPENIRLHFDPQQPDPMLVACLWDRWTAPGKPDLLSFAAVTDEPPKEVAATGHDRCIVPLKPESVRTWLDAEASDTSTLDGLLEDRQRPYYEHQLAA